MNARCSWNSSYGCFGTKVNFLIQKTKTQLKKEKENQDRRGKTVLESRRLSQNVHQQRTINEVIKTLKDIFSFKKDLKREECDPLQCITHRSVKGCGWKGRPRKRLRDELTFIGKLGSLNSKAIFLTSLYHMEQPHSQDTDSTFKKQASMQTISLLVCWK